VNPLYDGIISSTMKRYGIPEWLKPYIYKYAKESNILTIKHAISFINVRRKKGEVTAKYVKLPNGVAFDIKDVVHITDQFYYGLEVTSKITKEWATNTSEYNHADFAKYFAAVSKQREKQSRAVRNLVEGMGYKIGKPTPEIEEVFNHVSQLREWPDRIIATDVILRDAYSRPFGFIFYKVFYPVSPEFMRSLGKVFVVDDAQSRWADEQIRRIIAESSVSNEHIVTLSEEILQRVFKSIQNEMSFAKKAKIEPEAKLLNEIAIAYPLHTLSELGVEVDIHKEVKKITGQNKK
jgi:hypothetical protein